MISFSSGARLIFLTMAMGGLTGCAGAVIGAISETSISVAEERSVGRKVDDLTLYTEINHLFLQADSNDVLPHVTVNVRHGRVMLTGNVNTQKAAELAVQKAWEPEETVEVINEINVNPESDFFDSANDALIKKNLETRLFFTKNVWVINYSIDIVGNVAYLLGNVKDGAELDRVLNVTRTTQGVKKVISHLKIVPRATPTRSKPKASSPPSSAEEAISPVEDDGGYSRDFGNEEADFEANRDGIRAGENNHGTGIQTLDDGALQPITPEAEKAIEDTKQGASQNIRSAF
jgi:osmotically-inducible protein OsmY